MSSRDPKLTALMFNECINARDLDGLSALMTGDHTFIDREGGRHAGKDRMTEGWRTFFEEFPEYRNTFLKVESTGDRVVIFGYAEWTAGGDRDQVIWTAAVRHDLIEEWRVYEDTEQNRRQLAAFD